MASCEITPGMVEDALRRMCNLKAATLRHAYDVGYDRVMYRLDLPEDKCVTFRVDQEDHRLSMQDFCRKHLAAVVQAVLDARLERV